MKKILLTMAMIATFCLSSVVFAQELPAKIGGKAGDAVQYAVWQCEACGQRVNAKNDGSDLAKSGCSKNGGRTHQWFRY